ncbi:MAG TPA: hypothetical protein VK726_09900, partial [Acetobacteraceae bacterium]|nr:hypothetical protein [Acetobacteraceae bacterium]
PANMAVIKHTALNLLTQAKPITSLKNRRKKAGWNQDYLLNVVTGTAYVIQAIPLDRPGTDLAMRPWLRETDALGQRGYAMDAPWQPAAGSG